MGRHKQPQIREELLDRCADYVLRRGLPERLAPLVEATGASSRMLIYHFGTRDDLLRETLRRARRRQREEFGRLLTPVEDQCYVDTLQNAWEQISGPVGQPFVALFDRLRVDESQTLWPGFRTEATTDWLAPLSTGLASIGCERMATTVLALIRGLLMDLEATGDRERVDDAMTGFLQSLVGHVR